MEPLTLLASTVGLIASLHIAFSVEDFFTQGRYSKGNTKSKREDWYCFFQTSDLLKKSGNNNLQSTAGTELNIEQRKRQQVNRPRLQA